LTTATEFVSASLDCHTIEALQGLYNNHILNVNTQALLQNAMTHLGVEPGYWTTSYHMMASTGAGIMLGEHLVLALSSTNDGIYDVNSKDAKGHTLLDYAIINEDLACCFLLIRFGVTYSESVFNSAHPFVQGHIRQQQENCHQAVKKHAEEVFHSLPINISRDVCKLMTSYLSTFDVMHSKARLNLVQI
jgi:hypothetical protein